ncbi:DUF1624 domain-containing protein [Chryseolinea lacunae]|uniref:DUF1624 domain-containing protein n=1 Tax=Chryseolinea lacunae TaxID=2801331 RepID=A0ABS1KTJ6_9BACT|nr:heparan-alpha-glucosaminide N-acetyltransferase domain-containing protein [Chryseolinea lacunae]MBL0742670.1 DUF1624 domain-containing protein [Chryseolinea lacunae]
MTTATPNVLVEKPRISSIDMMRGIVMVIMALDHTRDYFHIDAFTFDPTDLTKTSPILFFTRWITHFCAPTFVFLSGLSARISRQNKTVKELSRFLLTRGLWLVVLEVTVVRFGLLFNFYYDFTMLQVIWAIGASMMVLSALVYLGDRTVLVVGLVIVFVHNALELINVSPESAWSAPWAMLVRAGFFPVVPDHFIGVPYPVLPWLGIMLTGYGLGTWYTKGFDATRRQTLLLRCGLGALALFVVLRFINVYGDAAPWSVQKDALFTFMSFINCSKYPVSLLFTLMILGQTLIILSLLERRKWKAAPFFLVYGRVPLFYFLAHFYLIHLCAILYRVAAGTPFSEIDFHFSKGFGGIAAGTGVSLPWVYFVWISVVLVLYPVCAWYNRYKSTHKDWWLSYL